MKLGTKKRSYPYSKSRVFFSAIITVLSSVMAFTLLANEHILILYYLLSTSLITIATFLLKMRLYPLITEVNPETEKDRTPRRILLLTFCMVIAVLFVPLVLAGFLSGASWFILIVSYSSGVSISEIIFYFSCK